MHGLIIDNFAGGGGASTGIEAALGCAVDYAINHDAAALAMHAANHPSTVHLQEDVFKVSPRKLCAGRKVALAWFSPDCKHFSKAKGGKPVSKRIRGLAWVAVRWAKEARPDIIVLENVEEFVTWGPLLPDGKPDPARRGLTFKRFVGNLRGQGYVVEWRELVAADYGAPTTRKRLFLIARRDGQPITWPEPTHRNPKLPADMFSAHLPTWRTAAECINWSEPCPSIFTRKKALADKTLRRIAAGIMRYVIKNPAPFIVPLTHAGQLGRVYGSASPLPTVTGANRGEMAVAMPKVTPVVMTNTSGNPARGVDEPLKTATTGNHHYVAAAEVAPFITECANASNQRNMRADEPLRTQCAEVKGGHFAVVTGSLVGVGGRAGDSRPRGLDEPTATGTAKADVGLASALLVPRYTERDGQAPRAMPVDGPMPTVVPTGNGASLVAAHLTKFHAGTVGQDMRDPMPTVTSNSHDPEKSNPGGAAPLGVVAAHLSPFYGQSKGSDVEAPAPTVMGTHNHHGMVAANLTHFYSSNTRGGEGDPEKPLKTITAQGGHAGLVTAFMAKHYGDVVGHGMERPIGAVTAVDHHSVVEATLSREDAEAGALRVASFLITYYGQGLGQPFDDPMRTITVRDRLALVTVTIQGEPYLITDIGLRMLQPRELALAQGFPADYALPGTKSSQVARIGNSVCPPLAEAIVRANMPRREQREAVA